LQLKKASRAFKFSLQSVRIGHYTTNPDSFDLKFHEVGFNKSNKHSTHFAVTKLSSNMGRCYPSNKFFSFI